MVEIENVKDAIKTAIQMEKDGYDFYSKAAAQTSSDMGRDFFESLARDELTHLDIFQKLFDKKVGENEWDDLVKNSAKYVDIPIFPKDLKHVEGANPDTNEIDAIRIAMDSEQRAIEWYTRIKAGINDNKVNGILDEIINQEKNHYIILEGEFNHINSTGYWFELDYLGSH